MGNNNIVRHADRCKARGARDPKVFFLFFSTRLDGFSVLYNVIRVDNVMRYKGASKTSRTDRIIIINVMYNARTAWWRRRHRPSSAGDYSTRSVCVCVCVYDIYNTARTGCQESPGKRKGSYYRSMACATMCA